jgi:hypothetical protein
MPTLVVALDGVPFGSVGVRGNHRGTPVAATLLR